MKAPISKPTPKTEKRLAASANPLEALTPPANGEYVQIDLQELVSKMLGAEQDSELVTNEIIQEAYKRLETEDEIDSVKAILSEFFDSYMLLGYGVGGKRTIIRHAKSDRDDDSIVELLRYVFMRMMQGGGN